MKFETGQTINDRYRIARVLDEENHRTTYRGWDVAQDKAVFLEQIHRSAMESAPDLAQERAASLQNIKHPNLPDVIETFEHEGSLVLVSAQADGESLAGRLDRQGPAEIGQALGWINQIIDGLNNLHSLSPPIAHGDLNPQNVRIMPDGSALLTGICLPSSQFCLPATGYAAVELYQGQEATPASDIYALGATLYTILTGRIPPESPQRAAGRELAQAHSVNPKVPPGIHAVIEKAMALEPGERIPTSGELRTALMQALVVPPPSPDAVPERKDRGTKPIPEPLAADPKATARLPEAELIPPSPQPVAESAPQPVPQPAAQPPPIAETQPPYTPTMKSPEPAPFGSTPLPPEASYAAVEDKKPFPLRSALIIAFVVLCIAAIGLGFGGYAIVTNIQHDRETQTAEAIHATEAAATTTQRYITTSTAAAIATRNANATATANQATAYAEATQQFIAGQTATAVAKITEQFIAAQSATAAAQATRSAQMTATQVAWLGIVEPLGFPTERTMVFGPWGGRLDHEPNDQLVESYFADVDLKNFVVQALFVNPFSSTSGKWSYGFMFRDTGRNSEYRMVIRSNATWALERWNGSRAGNVTGSVNNLKTGDGDENLVMLICVDGVGYLFVNGDQIAELDISRKQEPGDIAVVTGFFSGEEKEGKTTAYEDFTIWSIP